MTATYEYVREGAEIYRRSFAMIRAEADLARFAGAEERLVVRMIHACGMTDLPGDVEMSAGFADLAARALRAGAPILCDSKMVANGDHPRSFAGLQRCDLHPGRSARSGARPRPETIRAAPPPWNSGVSGFRVRSLCSEMPPRPCSVCWK